MVYAVGGFLFWRDGMELAVLLIKISGTFWVLSALIALFSECGKLSESTAIKMSGFVSASGGAVTLCAALICMIWSS